MIPKSEECAEGIKTLNKLHRRQAAGTSAYVPAAIQHNESVLEGYREETLSSCWMERTGHKTRRILRGTTLFLLEGGGICPPAKAP